MEKLVRDLIPHLMEKRGQTPNYHVAEDGEFEKRLFDKLLEKANELRADHSIQEFADMMDIMETIKQLKGYSWDDVDEARRKKYSEKGAFEKKYILITGH
jgi:predicted house-cleaning noncanonical NTP pyrophosphatase (MazG superfamily)